MGIYFRTLGAERKYNLKFSNMTNWWNDPENKEEIERMSWWNHENNKETFHLPISVMYDDGVWIAATNKETEKILGDRLRACSEGETKKEAIDRMLAIIRDTHEYSEECRLNYQRFVPLRKGNWKRRGGKWVALFGLHIYFRYGKGMKGGTYLPLTKLNISFSSDWRTYKKYKVAKKQIQQYEKFTLVR